MSDQHTVEKDKEKKKKKNIPPFEQPSLRDWQDFFSSTTQAATRRAKKHN
jgi:hypothetical protein